MGKNQLHFHRFSLPETYYYITLTILLYLSFTSFNHHRTIIQVLTSGRRRSTEQVTQHIILLF
jgi:hypothetical protein